MVTDPEAGQRIDIYLSKKITSLSRSSVSRLIDDKNILVNQNPTTKSYRIKKGDKLSVSLAAPKAQDQVEPQKLDFRILYEDDHLLVISKPAGIVCHPGPGHDSRTLVNALVYRCDRLSGMGHPQRPGLVHRLDKDTSGLIVIAKDDSIYENLTSLFKERKVKKNYIALVQGIFFEKKGRIILPVARSAKDRKKMSVAIDRGREAITEFNLIKEYDEEASLLDVTLETGRTHQIRVHLGHIGHPVVGDRTYGNKISMRLAEKIGLDRHFLHANRLEFIHPVTQNPLKVEDTLPSDLKSSLDRLEQFTGNQ